MAHGGGPGAGFGGGPGGPGAHGGPGGFGPGGLGPGGHFGLHSGGPPGFVGRGGYSQGHYDSAAASGQKTGPKSAQPHLVNTNYNRQNSPKRPPAKSQSPTRRPSGSRTRPSKTHSTHPQQIPDLPPLFADQTIRRYALVLAVLALTLACTMCMSNILATKVWALGPIILDGGFILFPLTYVLTDVIVELYYRKIGNFVVLCSCMVNLAAFAALRLTVYLPAAPGVMQVEPSQALGLSARIMVASAIGIIISTIVNNHIYDYMRRYESRRNVTRCAIRRRAWVSSFFAHMPDSALFTVIAFYGYSSWPKLLQQMCTSYLGGIVVETLLLPLTGIVAHSLRQYLDPRQD